MNDQLADALAKQETMFQEWVTYFEQVVEALSERSNALLQQLYAERRVAVADLTLAELGLKFNKVDED